MDNDCCHIWIGNSRLVQTPPLKEVNTMETIISVLVTIFIGVPLGLWLAGKE